MAGGNTLSNTKGLRRGNPGNKGGGRSGHTRQETAEVRRISRRLLKRPSFQKSLQTKLDDLTLHPSLVALLYYYGYGKPKDEIDVKQVVPVRIVHEYADGE